MRVLQCSHALAHALACGHGQLRDVFVCCWGAADRKGRRGVQAEISTMLVILALSLTKFTY